MIIIIAWIIYLYILFKGRFWLKVELSEFYKENGKIIIAVRILAGIALVYLIYARVIPDIKDIPYLRNEEYYESSGKATGNSISNGSGTRGVEIETEDGEVIHISVYNKCDDIKTGDYLTAKYLPNSKRGIITKHVHGGQKNEN